MRFLLCQKTRLTLAAVSLMIATLHTSVAAFYLPELQTKEGAREFIKDHCFAGTNYILLDNGAGTFWSEKSYPPSPFPAADGVTYPNGHRGGLPQPS
jgi:hypothetical protein